MKYRGRCEVAAHERGDTDAICLFFSCFAGGGGGAGLWCDVVVLKLGGGSHDWTSFRNISVFFVNNGYLV